jgi:TonB family protein
MRRAAHLLTAVVLACLIGGCGYSVGLGGNLPSHIKTVAVPIFVNGTQQPAVEGVITAAVINAFVTSGRLKVVSVREADSILEGTVTLYAVIHADGTVSGIKVLESVDPRLDEAAVKALSRWQFRPGTKAGDPVELEAVVMIPFKKHHPAR